jgi:HK97 family phage portal protein
VGLFTRSIRPPDPEVPNGNDPVTAAPGSVGPPDVNPGDPHGVTLEGTDPPNLGLPRIMPSPWSGWPSDWWPPNWGSDGLHTLTDTAWMCVDFNANQLSSMPPYLKNAAPTLSSDWLNNPNPDLYTSWEEFAKQLFWDYQLGEAFVIADGYYSTGWPARFHVVQPWYVTLRIEDGLRRYEIGGTDVTDDMLHVRYTSTVSQDPHGHGPLEAGRYRMVAAEMLIRYGMKLTAGGGIPAGVLEHPEELTQEQATLLQAQWVQSRVSTIGEPAVLSGGVTWKPTQINPAEMALTTLLDREEGRIAHLLGVPSELVGIPTSTDPMTYKNVSMWFDLHWRTGLRPKAQHVMAALSDWALPRGTTVELNRDEYVAAEPLERAQTAQILNSIVDKMGNPALTVQEIRDSERLDNTQPTDISSGVLR